MIIIVGGGYRYWCKLAEINNCLSNFKNNFIIVSEFKTAIEIKRTLLFKANCIIVYVHSDDQTIYRRMKDLDYTEDEIDFRIQRMQHIWYEYVNQSALAIQHVILNVSTLEDLYKQLDNIIDLYN